MKQGKKGGALFALAAAALYALNAPCSKLLLNHIGATMLAALLYLGAGAGMLLVGLACRRTENLPHEQPLSRPDRPYILAMVLLDIAAPICLLLGLARTTAANASLLNNFEIVATSLTALVFFGEVISRRLWIAIGLVTASCLLLSFEGAESFSFSSGSLLILLACVCWGFENNCTRRLSCKDPLQTVVIKGFGSGGGSLVIALLLGERISGPGWAAAALVLGFFAYGLSIYCYIRAQRTLGAAKTSTYYAAAPFIGTGLSLLVFREAPAVFYWAGLGLMAVGAWLASTDMPKSKPQKPA